MSVEKIGTRINRVVETIGIAMLILLVGATSLQVISRYVFNASISWSDELSRYCFIWCSMIGAAVAFWHGSHAAIDFLVARLQGKAKMIQSVLVYLIILYICAVLTFKGFQAVTMVHAQRSTAMHIPMSLIYASLPVNATLIAFYSVLKMIGLFQTSDESK